MVRSPAQSLRPRAPPATRIALGGGAACFQDVGQSGKAMIQTVFGRLLDGLHGRTGFGCILLAQGIQQLGEGSTW